MGYKRHNLLDLPAAGIGLAPSTSNWRALRAWVVAVALLSMGLACGRNIGDSCASNSDCDPTSGTRTCDLSQPGGYCLIEGCDARSCPSNSLCVRAFPGAFLSKACSPDVPCDTDEICLPQPTTSSGSDAGSEGGVTGLCARLSLEKRLCLQTCGSNGDCRGGYACVPTGTDGTLALTLDPEAAAPPRYCTPAQ